jgi:hypothetical protein
MSGPLHHPEQPIDSGTGLPIPPVGHIESQGDEAALAQGVDSAVRIDAAKEKLSEQEAAQPPRYLFARISVVLIMLMWVTAGFFKVSDMSRFVDVVTQHRVLPEEMMALLWWVGPGELVMGLLLVFVMGSELRKPFGKLVLLISLGSIGGFIYYLSLVDPAVLQESGCGCLSDYRIASGMENSVRFFAMGRNVILIILHLVALFGPAMVDSHRRSKA